MYKYILAFFLQMIIVLPAMAGSPWFKVEADVDIRYREYGRRPYRTEYRNYPVRYDFVWIHDEKGKTYRKEVRRTSIRAPYKRHYSKRKPSSSYLFRERRERPNYQLGPSQWPYEQPLPREPQPGIAFK